MNWIGGQLQRSKANANALVKTQKRHFAKARLRVQNGQSSQPPLDFSFAHDGHGLPTAMQDDNHMCKRSRRRKRSHSQETIHAEFTHGLESPSPRHHQKSSPANPRRKRRRSEGASDHRDGEIAAATPKPTRHLHKTAHADKSRLVSVADHSRKSARTEANTLQNVKRNLLNKSDWMGLAAARPLKMAFTTAEEMENIGKRRRMGDADGRSKPAAQLVSRFRPAVHRSHGMNPSGSNTSVLNAEDASVRIGANIHQTQTTPVICNKQRSVPNASQGESTESMLLDKFDESAFSSRQVREHEDDRQPSIVQNSLPLAMLLEDDAGSADWRSNRASRSESSLFPCDQEHASSNEELLEHENRLILPTLNELRDSKNFDELKARSATKSARGLVLSLPPLPRPTTRNQVARNSAIVDDSSSVVNSRPLFPSGEDHATSAGEGTIAEQVSSHRKASRDHEVPRTDTTQLSSEFSAEHAKVDVAHQGSSYGHNGQANPPTELDASTRWSTANAVSDSETWSQMDFTGARISRPAYTLEQQVSNEAIAKRQMGAYQDSSLQSRSNLDRITTLPSTTRSNQPTTKSHSRSSQYGGIIPPVEDQPVGFCEAAVFGNTAANAGGSTNENPGAKVVRDACLHLQNGSIETPCQTVPEAALDLSGLPDLPRAPTLYTASRTGRVDQRDKWLFDTTPRLPWKRTAEGRHSDEGKALTSAVIQDPAEMGNSFKFGPRVRYFKAVNNGSSPQNSLDAEQISRLFGPTGRPLATDNMPNNNPTKSIHTSINTTLYEAESLSPAQQTILSQPSQTDFLTQLSPMEGKFDERLANISVYNNAARSFRNFIPTPSTRKHSGQPTIDDADGTRACISGLDGLSSRRPIGSAFSRTQETDINTWKSPSLRHQRLLGSGSTHRQRLQASTAQPVVSSPFSTRTALAGRTRNLSSRNVPIAGSPRTSSPSTNLARKTCADTRALQTPCHSIGTSPLNYTPIRASATDTEPDDMRTLDLDYSHHSQAFSVPKKHGGLLDGVQGDPMMQQHLINQQYPTDHKSELQNDHSPDVLRNYDTDTPDGNPSAGEDALHTLSTGSLKSYGESPTTSTSNSRPDLVFHNIHTKNPQPFTFRKPRPFVGIGGNRGRQDEGSETVRLHDVFEVMGDVTRRKPMVSKFKMPDKPIHMADSVDDDIESELNTQGY